MSYIVCISDYNCYNPEVYEVKIASDTLDALKKVLFACDYEKDWLNEFDEFDELEEALREDSLTVRCVQLKNILQVADEGLHV